MKSNVRNWFSMMVMILAMFLMGCNGANDVASTTNITDTTSTVTPDTVAVPVDTTVTK